MNISDFINAYFADVLPPEPQEAEIPNKFYAHIDLAQLLICAISPEESKLATIQNIEIDSVTAIKFLSGEESFDGWDILVSDTDFKIRKKVKSERVIYNRVNAQSIVEVKELLNYSGHDKYDIKFEDVLINIDHVNQCAEIHYNGNNISGWARPVKLYFTGYGDPSYLKCSFSLDINIVNDLKRLNNLTNWPNPIIVPLLDTDDLSVYTVRSNLIIKLNHIEQEDYYET